MGTKLYVGNLSYGTTDETLRELFGADGRTVKDVAIILDRETRRPRGFAFVEMGSEEEAKAAAGALDGKEVDGRALRVNEAREREPRRGGYGGGRGGHGGYGGGRGGGPGGGQGGRGPRGGFGGGFDPPPFEGDGRGGRRDDRKSRRERNRRSRHHDGFDPYDDE